LALGLLSFFNHKTYGSWQKTEIRVVSKMPLQKTADSKAEHRAAVLLQWTPSVNVKLPRQVAAQHTARELHTNGVQKKLAKPAVKAAKTRMAAVATAPTNAVRNEAVKPRANA
jgi:hypothetical protein